MVQCQRVSAQGLIGLCAFFVHAMMHLFSFGICPRWLRIFGFAFSV